MSEDALKLPIEFPDADRTQLQLQEVLKSLGAVERKILETGASSEANARKILALTTAFTQGKTSADQLRAQLIALAGDLPKTADALKRDAAEAAAAAAKKLDEAATSVDRLWERVKGLNQSRDVGQLGSSFGQLRAQIGESTPRAVGFARGMGEVVGIMGATTAGAVAAAGAFGHLAAAGDTNARALDGLRGGFSAVRRETAGTVSALSAYRAQQTLVNSGLRISGEELATVARHAREHRDVTKSAEDAVQELTEALRNGEAEGLRKYGIAVEQGATRAQTFERALEQMRRSAEGARPAVRDLGESMTALTTGASDAVSGFAALAASGLGLDGVVRNLSTDIRRLGDDLTELNARRASAARSQADEAERARLLEDVRRNRTAIAQTLRQQGMSLDLLPGTDLSLNRLNTQQLTEAAGTLASIRAESEGLRSTTAADIRIGPSGLMRPRSIENISTGLGANDAERALTSLQGARGSAGAAARDAARQMLETRLGAFLGSIREALNPAETPRDSAAAAPTPPPAAARATASSPRTVQRETVWSRAMDADFADIERTLGARRIPTFGRARAAQMDTEDSLRQRELTESPQAMARLAQLRDRETRDREARLDDQRLSVQQAEQLVSLRRDEARFRRPIEVARQTALLNAQANVEHQRRMVSLAADIARASLERGAANQVAEERLSGRSSRARARNSREAERQDLRDPAVERERLADAREEHSLGKERDRLQYRIDAQVSFTDRMEELSGRRRSAAQMEAEAVTGAFGAMGEAFSSHLQAVIAGREDLGTALQGMLSDTLMAISKESAIKAGLYLAEGFASLVSYQYDRAAAAFAASAIFTGVAVASGLGGAALAPAAPATSAASGAADRGRQLDTGRKPANDTGSGGATIIEMHYYSPVIGGRDATEAEVGRGMQRYQSAADRRRLGRTGTDG